MITLTTLNNATTQEVFDQAAKHMLTQHTRSEIDGECLYRGPDDLKCAVGCFISDREYKQTNNGRYRC